MKKIFFIISLAIGLFSTGQVLAQCGDELLDICYPKIGDYKYIKSYPIRLKKSRKGEPPIIAKYAVVLNGGVKYKIVGCNATDFDGKIVITLYNGDTMIGSTYDYNIGKEYPGIEFECKKSGVYYLSFYFRDGKEGCAICILAQK